MARQSLITVNNSSCHRSNLCRATRPQEKNSEKKLAETFRWYRENRIDLAPITILKPVLDAEPTLDSEGLLRVQGKFPSRPLEIRFAAVYRPVAKTWKLDGISLSAKNVSPNAAN